MNTEFDPLETELRSLRPRDPSAGLKEQIAARIAAPAPTPGRPAVPGWLWFAKQTAARVHSYRESSHLLAAAALAACVLALATYIPRNTEPTIVSPPPLAESPATAAFDVNLPSVWQLHNVLNRSGADLDAALDQHAARPPAPAVSVVQIRGFGHSDSNLETLLGEL